MNNLDLLIQALEYMEEHLQEDIHTEDIADACYCSKSTLEKLFRYINHISVRDYLVRRRMSKAAKLLVENQKIGVLDVALQFGYSSNEAFTRAFKQVWNCKPSDFREKQRIPELFPRLNAPVENGDDFMMTRKNFDISELYDLFRQRKDCCFVCCDINGLIPINDISHKAGDLAILETMNRMENAAGEDDVIFRIGGDEFALLTNSPDVAYAKEIIDKILAYNGNPIDFEGQQIPLSLRIGLVKQNGKSNIKYNELFQELHSSLRIPQDQ